MRAPIDHCVPARFPGPAGRFVLGYPPACAGWAPPSWEGIPSETFTAIEQLCHIRDTEVDNYHLRLRRLLTEDAPSLVSIDSYQVARERSYPDAPVAQIFQDFRAARAHTVAMLEGLGDAQWQRKGTFEGYGPVTVKALAHYLCSHDQQHLAGLHWLLGAWSASHS